MQFRLRSLLLIVTVCGVLVGYMHFSAEQQKQLEAHRASFDKIDSTVNSLDSEIAERILQIPSVASELAKRPSDPSIALGRSIIGESISFGIPRFNRNYHFSWQREDGSRCEGVRITVAAVMNEDLSAKHSVNLAYRPNELNNDVAMWIADQITSRHQEIDVVHVTQEAASSSVSQVVVVDETNETLEQPLVNYGGIR